LYRQLPRIDPLQVGLVQAAHATTSDEVMLAALTPGGGREYQAAERRATAGPDDRELAGQRPFSSSGNVLLLGLEHPMGLLSLTG